MDENVTKITCTDICSRIIALARVRRVSGIVFSSLIPNSQSIPLCTELYFMVKINTSEKNQTIYFVDTSVILPHYVLIGAFVERSSELGNGFRVRIQNPYFFFQINISHSIFCFYQMCLFYQSFTFLKHYIS